MDSNVNATFEKLDSKDKQTAYEALLEIQKLIDNGVDWAYDVWDHLKEDLTSRDKAYYKSLNASVHQL
ncbi:hypothetical protein [Evansella tamaricis]|uniref:hypothetical protein n=1 Tax=Evansella tamaricis TaxID=2069301 RepID=UPI001FEC218F|nr:hypothetical protein [Evansella tamaricis]